VDNFAKAAKLAIVSMICTALRAVQNLCISCARGSSAEQKFGRRV